MNTLKVTVLLAAMTVLFVGLGQMFGGRNGMILAFVLAAVMNFAAYWFSDKIILAMYRARQITETDHPRLHRIVRHVSQKANVPMPKVFIVPSKGPNAFATGRGIDHAAVAVTEGLLEVLNDAELEGVIGHEFAHIINKDLLIGTIAATLAGAIGMIASMARWAFIFGGAGGRDREGGANPLAMIVAMIVAPLAAMLIQMGISRSREYKADETGGRITGRYLDLASALKKISRAPMRMNLDQKPATAHLMIMNPLSGKGITSLFSTHPPVEKRVERLEKLATEAPYY
jgi:heat shock protein HtpX